MEASPMMLLAFNASNDLVDTADASLISYAGWVTLSSASGIVRVEFELDFDESSYCIYEVCWACGSAPSVPNLDSVKPEVPEVGPAPLEDPVLDPLVE